MRRPGIEPEEDGPACLASLGSAGCVFQGSIHVADFVARYRSQQKCAGRELNPGYELGKLMSYH